MTVDSQTFRRTLGSFASGVTIVTSHDAEANVPVGITVSAFSSVSMDPPLIMVCLNNRSSSLPVIRSNGHFAVNILDMHQVALSNRFASKDEDKWSGVTYTTGLGNVPVLADTLAHLECQVTQIIEGGDHMIVFGLVKAASNHEDKNPLLYCRGSYGLFTGGHK